MRALRDSKNEMHNMTLKEKLAEQYMKTYLGSSRAQEIIGEGIYLAGFEKALEMAAEFVGTHKNGSPPCSCSGCVIPKLGDEEVDGSVGGQ